MDKVILWDWDNTLADTFGAIFAAQNDMRAHYGLPAWTKEESKHAMNTSGRNLIASIVGAENAAEARQIFLKAYATHAAEIELKPGAVDVLKKAKEAGFICVLASNKAGTILRNEAEAMGVTALFDKIIGAEDTDNDKPSKSFTDAALSGWNAGSIVSVGDGRSDIQMARNYDNGYGILVWTNPNSAEFETITPDSAVADLDAVWSILAKM